MPSLSENPFDPTRRNADVEEQLVELPDQVAAFLLVWRTKTLERERHEALLHLRFKGENHDRTATELKAMICADDTRFKVCLEEAKAESQYTKSYEQLMAAKRLAGLREAF